MFKVIFDNVRKMTKSLSCICLRGCCGKKRGLKGFLIDDLRSRSFLQRSMSHWNFFEIKIVHFSGSGDFLLKRGFFEIVVTLLKVIVRTFHDHTFLSFSSSNFYQYKDFFTAHFSFWWLFFPSDRLTFKKIKLVITFQAQKAHSLSTSLQKHPHTPYTPTLKNTL